MTGLGLALTAALLAGLAGLAADARTCAPAVRALRLEHAAGIAVRAWTCLDVSREARAQGVEPTLAVAVAWHESRFDAVAESSMGARGPMQVIPRWWCPRGTAEGCDLTAAGVAALRSYLAQHDGPAAGLCAYNAGNKCGPRGRRYAEAVLASARRWGG